MAKGLPFYSLKSTLGLFTAFALFQSVRTAGKTLILFHIFTS